MDEDRLTPERMTVGQGQLVMPFYLLCDVSFSMYREMQTLNDGVRRLRQAIVAEPIVDDVAQVCVMTFSDTTKTVVPMGPMSESEIPHLEAENATNYGAAFRALAKAIDQDSARLKEQGHRVYRPCTFFLTDGVPTDADWHKTFVNNLTYDQRTKTGMKAHPIFVPFGYSDASMSVLGKLAYPPDRAPCYHASGASIDAVIKGVMNVIMHTVVSTARTASTDRPMFVAAMPDLGSGIEQFPSEFTADYDPDFL
jgi:uncharacterized protein YegL